MTTTQHDFSPSPPPWLTRAGYPSATRIEATLNLSYPYPSARGGECTVQIIVNVAFLLCQPLFATCHHLWSPLAYTSPDFLLHFPFGHVILHQLSHLFIPRAFCNTTSNLHTYRFILISGKRLIHTQNKLRGLRPFQCFLPVATVQVLPH